MNHFSLPNNPQEESETFKFPGLVEKTATVKNRNKCTLKPKRNKILINADSHARVCADELSTSFGKNFEVMGAVIHGFRLEYITHSACREISQLHCDHFVIMWGGANDINRSEPNTGLRHNKNFAVQNEHTNVITVTAPYRYDLQDSSCINKEIQVYNRKLHKC